MTEEREKKINKEKVAKQSPKSGSLNRDRERREERVREMRVEGEENTSVQW